MAEFNQVNLGITFNRLSGLWQLNECSTDLAELPASRQGDPGKDAAAVDPAGLDGHSVIRGGGLKGGAHQRRFEVFLDEAIPLNHE